MKMFNEVAKCVIENDKVVVGVSGGADSMVLLYLLNKVKATIPFTLKVLHVEHGIRGKESLRDANFVKEYCNNNKIDCTVVKVNIPQLAKQDKQTIEQSARNKRTELFMQYIVDGYKLFLAHNKNDQAETVLMHLFRGCGIDGARGIVDRENYYRPLLNFSKEEILQFAEQNKVPFVTDSTNDDTSYARNYIRNIVIPQIAKEYPMVVDNLVKFASCCSLCEKFISSNIDSSWVSKTKENVCVKRAVFKENDLLVAKVLKQAYNLCGQWQDLERKHIDFIKDMVCSCKNGAKYNLPHNIIVELRQYELLFYTKQQQPVEKCDFCLQDTILPNGKMVKICKNCENIEFGDGNFYLDYHKIPSNAVWRTRKDGDMFYKLGSRGKKKLNDYFTDKKLSLLERDNVMLLASGSNILLVLGYDISEMVKIDSNTLEIVKIGNNNAK